MVLGAGVRLRTEARVRDEASGLTGAGVRSGAALEQGRHYKHEWELGLGVGLRAVAKARARAKADMKWSRGRNANRIKSVNRSAERIRSLIGAGVGLRAVSRKRERERAKGDVADAGERAGLRAVTGAQEETGA